MDIREVKTKRNITNAFIELRAHKPLEKITVKELSEKAEISKATFYLHYKDIFDLSEQLQKEVIGNILAIVGNPDSLLYDMEVTHKSLQSAFVSYKTLIDILFSGPQESLLPLLLETEMKKAIFLKHPEYEMDSAINTRLSFLIMGSFYAYLHNSRIFDAQEVDRTISNILSSIARVKP